MRAKKDMVFVITEWYSVYVSIFKCPITRLTVHHTKDDRLACANFVAQTYGHVLISVFRSSTLFNRVEAQRDNVQYQSFRRTFLFNMTCDMNVDSCRLPQGIAAPPFN